MQSSGGLGKPDLFDHLSLLYRFYHRSNGRCDVGNLGQWTVSCEAAIFLALGSLMLLRYKDSTGHALGLMWLLLGMFYISALLLPGEENWISFGNFFIFVAAMLWIGFTGRLHPSK